MKQCFRKILLVEDDYIMKYVSGKLIKISGFAEEVVSMANGLEAKEYLIKMLQCGTIELPDLLFLDLYMNLMSGWEFLDWYKSWTLILSIHPPVYILSATINVEDTARANTYKDVMGLIKKPITIENLNDIKAVHLN